MDLSSRIISIDELEGFSADLRSSGKKIVASNGCFDILHIGHSRYLQASKSLADVLVLGLNSDESVKRLKGPDRPINNQGDRAELLLNLRSVDYIVIFNDPTAEDFLRRLKPDIYTKGGDYKGSDLEEPKRKLPEYGVLSEIGSEIIFLDFVEGKSTTKILERSEA